MKYTFFIPVVMLCVRIFNTKFNFLKHSLCGVVFVPESILVGVYRVVSRVLPVFFPAMFLFCILAKIVCCLADKLRITNVCSRSESFRNPVEHR